MLWVWTLVGVILGTTEQEILRLVNEEREKNNMDKLAVSDELQSVAKDHAAYMCTRGVLSQRASKGKLEERVREKGLKFRRLGQNVARSQKKNPAGVVRQWKKHDPHRRSILGDYTHTGVGVCKEENKNRWYYVQVYGKKDSNGNSLEKGFAKAEEYFKAGYAGYENDKFVVFVKPGGNNRGEDGSLDELKGKWSLRRIQRPQFEKRNNGNNRMGFGSSYVQNNPRDIENNPPTPTFQPVDQKVTVTTTTTIVSTVFVSSAFSAAGAAVSTLPHTVLNRNSTGNDQSFINDIKKELMDEIKKTIRDPAKADGGESNDKGKPLEKSAKKDEKSDDDSETKDKTEKRKAQNGKNKGKENYETKKRGNERDETDSSDIPKKKRKKDHDSEFDSFNEKELAQLIKSILQDSHSSERGEGSNDSVEVEFPTILDLP